ncbi:MAG: hypothetical protein AB1Z20_13220, partial [Desulfobacterales bacterium]
MEKKKLPRITILGKRIILSLLAFMLIWPLTVGVYTLVYKGYTLIDRTTFPSLDTKLKETLDQTPPDAPEAEKGVALSMALRNRLNQEMTSTFGWSVNDLLISPTRWLDNRANRQKGTIFALRMLLGFSATHLS